jgi:hypothetical protein
MQKEGYGNVFCMTRLVLTFLLSGFGLVLGPGTVFGRAAPVPALHSWGAQRTSSSTSEVEIQHLQSDRSCMPVWTFLPLPDQETWGPAEVALPRDNPSLSCSLLIVSKYFVRNSRGSSWRLNFSRSMSIVPVRTPFATSGQDNSSEAGVFAPVPDVPQASSSSQPSTSESEELAKQPANPSASLMSIPLQSNFEFGMGPKQNGFRYTMNIRRVIPIKLNDNWSAISRTIVPAIHQDDRVAIARILCLCVRRDSTPKKQNRFASQETAPTL